MSLLPALGLFLQVSGATSVIVDRARLDPKADVDFHAMAVPDTVYVGDAALYELAVFIADEVRQRLRRNPEFVPPELRSVLAYDLRDPRAARTVVRDGRTYEVHVFRRALFPVAPGRIVVPPARLSYAVPVGGSFFSREENKLLRSEPVTIIAIAPPAEGRPPTWGGAVGNLRIDAIVSAGAARVGDPFVVTLRVAGEANVHLLPRPVLTLSWASVVPSAERVVVDSMAPTVRGAKEFDWLVTPLIAGARELPVVEYAFFDPAARKYRLAHTSSESVSIGEGSLAAVDTVAPALARRATLPLRTVWRRPLGDAPDRSLWYLALATLVPIPAIARLVRERPRRRPRATPEAALHALSVAGEEDAARVRGVLHTALNARLGVLSVHWADAVALRRALRHHGVTDATIDDALVLFGRIDGAVYGNGDRAVPGVAASALALYDRIDDEARARVKTRRVRRAAARAGPRAGAVMVVFAAGALVAQATLSPRARFERALSTYAAGNALAAASDFFDAARATPGEAPAWANAGTASWTAADTARAVVGWQRALRLNPLDDDARRRLTLVGADAGAASSVVWPIPRRMPAWFALLLWVGGWIAMWRTRRRRAAAVALGAAVVLAVTSRVHHARLADPRIAVMAAPAPLRALPALGADASSTPLTGELLTVVERSGVWVRVTAGGNREGWLDAARVIDLDARPLRN